MTAHAGRFALTPQIEAANALDAEAVAQALGCSIELQGKHCEIASGERGTLVNGRLVWCHADQAGIGDNLALVQTHAGVSFKEALSMLVAMEITPRRAATMPAKKLSIPSTSLAAREAGTKYLLGRGIAPAAIDHAMKCGMLHFIDEAVLFLGFDGLTPKSATRRGYVAGDAAPKRDLAGSNKAFPAVFEGDASHVWVVEGGADALALHTLHPDFPPLAIVSGGSAVRGWIDMPHIKEILSAAKSVTVAHEREKNQETQERTDAQHEEQAKRIRLLCPDVRTWSPPAGFKDLADTLRHVAQPVRKTRIDISACFGTDPPPQDFILPGFLAGTVGALVAPGSTGKSMLALQLACAVSAKSANTTGIEINKTGPVLYIGLEDPKSEIWRRLHSMGAVFDADARAEIAQHLAIDSRVGIPTDVFDPEFFEDLLEDARGKRLVIVDTLSRCHSLNENDNGEMSSLIVRLEALAKASGAGVLFLHHISKAAGLAGQGGMQQAARGASALIDNARWCGNLVGMSEDEANKMTDSAGKVIGELRRGFFVRYSIGKQNYGKVESSQWYERGIGGILNPINLRSGGSSKSAASKGWS